MSDASCRRKAVVAIAVVVWAVIRAYDTVEAAAAADAVDGQVQFIDESVSLSSGRAVATLVNADGSQPVTVRLQWRPSDGCMHSLAVVTLEAGAFADLVL